MFQFSDSFRTNASNVVGLHHFFFINLLSSVAISILFFSLRERPLVSRLYGLFLSIYSFTVHITCAGFPPTTTPEGTDWQTTLPAATRTSLPIVTPGIINELLPIYTLLPISTFPKQSNLGYTVRATLLPPWVKILTSAVI